MKHLAKKVLISAIVGLTFAGGASAAFADSSVAVTATTIAAKTTTPPTTMAAAKTTTPPTTMAAAKTTTPPTTMAKKVTSSTISCVKGTVKKTVTGTSPKCPTGYKKA